MIVVKVVVLLLAARLHAEALKDGDVRLGTDRFGTSEGLVEVYYNGNWGSVCDDMGSGGTIETFGQVVCRNLGYTYISGSPSQRGRTERFLLDSVACKGTETNLDECGHSSYGSEDCGISEHVKVVCKDPCVGACDHICTRFNSTLYDCSCKDGYILNADQAACDDVNECAVNNGGCSHTCHNTMGGHVCDCPELLYLQADNKTCLPKDGVMTTECDSHKMTITFDKKEFFFFEKLTFDDTQCISASNSTHIWLTTTYDACGTMKRQTNDSIVYTNHVRSVRPTGPLIFFESVEIPVFCEASRSTIISGDYEVVPNQLIMRIEGEGQLKTRFKLFEDETFSRELVSHNIPIGERVFAGLTVNDHAEYNLSVTPNRCEVRAKVGNVEVMRPGPTPVDAVRAVIHSSGQKGFYFSFMAFISYNNTRDFTLVCDTILTTPATTDAKNASNIITAEEFNEATLPGEENVQGMCQGLAHSQRSTITVDGQVIDVYCDLDTEDGPWITFLNRYDGSIDFNRSYSNYKNGFGHFNYEFWLGLENLHQLTKSGEAVLRIDVEKFNNETAYAIYQKFRVGSKETDYTLEEISGYSGTAGDMEVTGNESTGGPHKKMKFSTYDRDFDKDTSSSCAAELSGGWWYRSCFTACLTCGPYHNKEIWGMDNMMYFPFTKAMVGLRSASMKLKLPASVRDVPAQSNQTGARPIAVDIKTQANISCEADTMKLKLSKNLGVQNVDDLQLREDCSAMTVRNLSDHWLIEAPLRGCGSVVEVAGDNMTFTNSLIYRENRTSTISYFSDVTLTFSCLYPRVGGQEEFDYSVGHGNFRFAPGGGKIEYDINLNLFKDDRFTEMLRTGSKVSVDEGRKLFGSTIVKSSDPNLKVALNSCKVSSTNNPDDPKSQSILRDGCTTAFGTNLLNSASFALDARSFTMGGHEAFLHCTVIVCDARNSARCDRKCNGGDVFGKRDLAYTETRMVSAGPYFF